jgi:hypothetical protein
LSTIHKSGEDKEAEHSHPLVLGTQNTRPSLSLFHGELDLEIEFFF